MIQMDEPIDLSWITGKELIQVCIGSYQVILRFTYQLIITIECPYSMSMEEAIVEASGDDPETSKNLVCLLEHSINSCHQHENGEFVLDFSNGYSLKLIPETTGAESFSIKDGEYEILA